MTSALRPRGSRRRLTVVLSVLGGGWLAGVASADERPAISLRGHRGAVRQLVFHPNSKWLVSAGYEDPTRIWNLETRKIERTLSPRGRTVEGAASVIVRRQVECLAFAPGGEVLGEVASDATLKGVIELWKVPTGEPLRTLAEGQRNVRALAISSDGRLVASNVVDPDRFAHSIIVRDFQTGQTLATLAADQLSVTLLAFTPDGGWLVSAGGKKIHIWEMPSGKLLHAIPAHDKNIESIAIAPDGKTLASGSEDALIKLWNLEDGKMIREIKSEQDAVHAVTLSPSGRTLASGGKDGTTRLWSPASGKQRGTLWAHVDRVLCAAFSPDGKWLATGSRDGTISVWKFEEPAEEKDEKKDK